MRVYRQIQEKGGGEGEELQKDTNKGERNI